MLERRGTKDLIADSFAELGTRAAMTQITVQDIVDNCGVSRRTFYHHFRDKYDIIGWMYAREFAPFFEDCMARGDYLYGQIRSIELFIEKIDYYTNMLENTSGLDSAFEALVESTVDVYCDYFARTLGPDIVTDRMRFDVRMLVVGTMDAIHRWYRTGQHQDAAELASWIIDNMPERLKPLLIASSGK